MYVTPEQIQAANKANVESILSLAASQFAALEKFANLNASAVKTAFEDTLSSARTLLGAKDVQEFVSLQSSLAQPTIEKAIAYSKSAYEVATEANSEMSKMAEKRIAEWNENFVSMLDKATKNAPAGWEGAGRKPCRRAPAVWDGAPKPPGPARGEEARRIWARARAPAGPEPRARFSWAPGCPEPPGRRRAAGCRATGAFGRW